MTTSVLICLVSDMECDMNLNFTYLRLFSFCILEVAAAAVLAATKKTILQRLHPTAVDVYNGKS